MHVQLYYVDLMIKTSLTEGCACVESWQRTADLLPSLEPVIRQLPLGAEMVFGAVWLCNSNKPQTGIQQWQF